ncbi:LysR family transcriptional regulator [Chelatococcus sp. SYSU_G07232]|uniref:LysR family transcriptional regulator n=1 Tax=Chelatococcus albus TaxID=3047466 RepID=A0ABT7AL46_9HYPH|nr:LysR family transcriptional regulator [Chelatococcus sp. SYSU_G07232]MDJ1159549.1 LysR family transcriptional regulator [Chelatococcus sp. SYSU_G07232]
MDRLDCMRAFVAVAEEAGFAAAARRLALSPPAVTRAVAALEERIGARLLHRTTRLVRLTEAGARYLADCKRILAEIEEAEGIAAGAHGELRGPLTVTASVLFGRMFVAPIVLDFLVLHPGVSARTLLLDRVVDLLEEGIDVAVRIAHLPDSSLSAVRVGTVRRVVCAAPAYLAARGVPRSPADLARHEVVAFAPSGVPEEWVFTAEGRRESIRLASRLVVNTADVAIAAAVAGHGLTRVLSYMIEPELRAGRLEIVLCEYEPPPVPIHVAHAEGRRAAARVRAFVDFAAKRLRSGPVLG